MHASIMTSVAHLNLPLYTSISMLEDLWINNLAFPCLFGC